MTEDEKNIVLVYFKMAYIEERNKKGRGGGASLLKAKIPEKSNVYILCILSLIFQVDIVIHQ